MREPGESIGDEIGGRASFQRQQTLGQSRDQFARFRREQSPRSWVICGFRCFAARTSLISCWTDSPAGWRPMVWAELLRFSRAGLRDIADGRAACSTAVVCRLALPISPRRLRRIPQQFQRWVEVCGDPPNCRVLAFTAWRATR